MKRFCVAIIFAVVAASAYAASPFVTAWRIREAVRSGNSEYLATAIEWPSVRETLKPSIAHIALDLPEQEQTPPKAPTLWQRFKVYWGKSAVDQLVDSYVTPEGLPKLFTMRKAYRNYVETDDGTNALPILERISRGWARVKRAKFTALTTFEIDMADKHDASRIYLGKLELTRTGWKLTGLRLRLLTTAKSAIQRLAG
ncbi:DUF2939 domain-containing protein [Hyphomicrobium sp.]|jgi:hypothetical protein|uniref:DUF2939 domain-containing protein n=1 Tax=Hyphomicrobium sp. TaxID=82 RepID=UPI002C968F76|nr:DUF2939 domain-containing protein [Hyphomicrobium sp.]HVZ04253.1 DUF2939 domain-containing protein [Hyphomicrobium sp.]